MTMRIVVTTIFVLSAFPSQLLAWENHALATFLALSQMPQVTSATNIKVESFEAFLKAEEKGLAELLAKEEAWAAQHVDNYPKIPAGLVFKAGGDPLLLKKRFLNGLRANPGSKFTLSLQEIPGKIKPSASYLPLDQVTLMPNSLPKTARKFIALTPGQQIAAIDIFSTASDEPDYGLDIKLWSDSATEFGRVYGFGAQGYGNPKLEYSTQAQFHMGYFHEPRVIQLAAGDKMLSLVEYRIHEFFSLAQFAFKSGHPYWGWRFAGMGAHYIQDLTQPYHSKMVPGVNTFWLLAIGLMDKVGFTKTKDEMVQRVSAEHLAIENIVNCAVNKALINMNEGNQISDALRVERDPGRIFAQKDVKQFITSDSSAYADQVSAIVQPIASLSPDSQCAKKYSDENCALFAKLMQNFGNHTRAWIRAVVSAKPIP